MKIYDASTDDYFNPLVEPLTQLHGRLPDFLLIGSWARDVCLRLGAGEAPGRATNDLDIAVAIDSLKALDQSLGDLGPRRGNGVRIQCAGSAVDVLPYGDLATNGWVEPTPGTKLDVTGLPEARRHADTLVLPGDLRVWVPSLPFMIALKLIAWAVRGRATDKDATDLVALLPLAYAGSRLDDCFQDDELLIRFDGDPAAIGPYLIGRELAHGLEVPTHRRLTDILAGEGDRLLALVGPRHAPQIEGLVAGLAAVVP